MNIYEEYAKVRSQIEELNEKKGQLSEQILSEIAQLSEPMKTTHGMFSKVISTKYVFSEGFYAFNEKYQTVKSPTVNNLDAINNRKNIFEIKLFGLSVLKVQRL